MAIVACGGFAEQAVADELVNYASENLTERVMALTDGQGCGRILLIGFVAGVPQIPANRLLVKHRSAPGSSLRYFRWHAPDKLNRSVDRLPLERSVEAIRLLTDRKAHGKIVVMPGLR